METYPTELLLIAFIAMLAPLIAELPNNFRLPVTVLEVFLGMLIGPHVLYWASPDGVVGMMSKLGLSFLLFLVGLEIDFDRIRGKPLSLAISSWFVTFLLAIGSMFLFNMIGLINTPPILGAVALSSTALGVLMPILKDRDVLNTSFGNYIIATAAVGEFGPLMIISVLLIPTHDSFLHTLFVITFTIIALVAANIALHVRSSPLAERLAHTMQNSSQLPVRICILVQVFLATLAAKFELNIVMGAFAAGVLVGLVVNRKEGQLLRQKLDAVGYGFLIPIFFIVAGMKFEISALWSTPLAPIQVALLSGLLVAVRAIPLYLYKTELRAEEKLPFSFYAATGLPLIVIISEIGVSTDLMSPDKASILVSAGMVSVLLFPVLALRLRDKFVLPW